MESADALYAAAASLDMNLQLFCSYMPESTDEIILSYIRNATKLNTCVFPALPDFETLGESFLTRFPSINPLSSQAILSSGGTLVEYLEWSPERRIQAIGKFHVPEESISLFNTFCNFGEIGDSKSAMTECSSIDSEVSSDKLWSQRTRKKFETSSCNLDMTFDESLPVKVLKGLSDGHRERPQVSESYQSKKNLNIDIETKFQRNNSSINEVLGQKRRGSTSITSNSDKDRMAEWKYLDEDFGGGTLDMMFDESLSDEPLNGLSDGLKEKPQIQRSYQPRTTFSVDNENKFQRHGCSINEALGKNDEPLNGLSDGLKEKPQIQRSYQPRTTFNVDNENQFQRHSCSINEGLGKNKGGNISMTSSLNKNGIIQCNYLDEEFSTDVLDCSGTFRDGKHHFVPGNTSFLQAPGLLNELAVRSSLPARTMGTHSRTFPTSAEISRDMNKWAFPKDQNQIMDQKVFGRAALGSKRDDSFAKCNEDYMKENFVQEGITQL